MSISGFRSDTLSDEAGLLWVDYLGKDLGGNLFVLRNVTPARAIGMLGGEVVQELEPGELPEQEPEDE